MWLYLNAQISPLDCNGLSFGKKTFMLDMAKWLQSQTWLYTGKQEIVEQCLKDYQAYDPLSTVYSDHKIVVTKLRLSLLANGKTTGKRSHSVREAYTVEVKNRFEALYEIKEKHTVNDLYTTMIKAQMDAA